MYLKRLRNLREDADLTQAEVGEIIGCSQRSYSFFESGSRDMSLIQLLKFANYFDVSIDFLFERTNNKGFEHLDQQGKL